MERDNKIQQYAPGHRSTPNSGLSHPGTLSQARNYQHLLPPLVPWKGGEEDGSAQNRIEADSYSARARIHGLGCIGWLLSIQPLYRRGWFGTQEGLPCTHSSAL